jgi:hypothetical protein
VLVFDNLSTIPAEISDCLCRLSTGGGFAVCSLYTDDEETLFDGQRPIALTSINDVANRSDLADRLVIVLLETIPDDKRRSECANWSQRSAAPLPPSASRRDRNHHDLARARSSHSSLRGRTELLSIFGAKWLAHLEAGDVRCLICGERCGLDAKRPPILCGFTELEPQGLCFVSMCLPCSWNYDGFTAATQRMVQAIETAALTKGRSFGPIAAALEPHDAHARFSGVKKWG